MNTVVPVHPVKLCDFLMPLRRNPITNRQELLQTLVLCLHDCVHLHPDAFELRYLALAPRSAKNFFHDILYEVGQFINLPSRARYRRAHVRELQICVCLPCLPENERHSVMGPASLHNKQLPGRPKALKGSEDNRQRPTRYLRVPLPTWQV